MIEVIEGLPPHVAPFRANEKITAQDYEKTVNPMVEKIYRDYGKINYLLVINTPLSNYSAGAWIKDAVLGFVYFTEWNRIAIVSEKKGIKTFTNVFGKIIPGKTRGFMMSELEAARAWIAEKN